MYCRYTKTSIWDHKQCPLDRGECVLYSDTHLRGLALYLKQCSPGLPACLLIALSINVNYTQISLFWLARFLY